MKNLILTSIAFAFALNVQAQDKPVLNAQNEKFDHTFIAVPAENMQVSENVAEPIPAEEVKAPQKERKNAAKMNKRGKSIDCGDKHKAAQPHGKGKPVHAREKQKAAHPNNDLIQIPKSDKVKTISPEKQQPEK